MSPGYGQSFLCNFFRLRSVVLAAIFLLFPVCYANAADVIIESCIPKPGISAGGEIKINKGEAVVFGCTVFNKGEETAEVLLSGRLSKGNVLQNVVSSAVEIPGGKKEEAELSFFGVSEGGLYNYSIFIMDLFDGTRIGETLEFSGVMEAVPSLSIAKAYIEKKDADRGNLFFLNVRLAGEDAVLTGGGFLLDVFGEDEEGLMCGYLISNDSIKESEILKTIDTNVAEQCEPSSVTVMIKNREGTPVAEKKLLLSGGILAVSGSNSWNLAGGVVLIASLFISLYVWVRRAGKIKKSEESRKETKNIHG